MPKFHVQRSTHVKTSPEKAFELVSDFSTWPTWSPWLCAEPTAKVVISQDSNSVGSRYTWKGTMVGEGEMEHEELVPNDLIRDEIRFLKPFKSVSKVELEFEPARDGVSITWHMRGSLPLFLFWMVPSMNTFIGMDFERGLSMLKELLETGHVKSQTQVIGVASIGPFQIAGVRGQAKISAIGAKMDGAFAAATSLLATHGLPISGERVSVYTKLNMKTSVLDYLSGYMIPPEQPIPANIASWATPDVQAVRVDHIGSYENLGNAWSTANQYVRYKKLKQSRLGTFEIYKNDLDDTAAEELRTEVYLPLR